MLIKDMFTKDINREINGVIQVAQDTESVVYQEVSEYVVTNEIEELFQKFFTVYHRAFSEPTNGIGVWISGFFGSGKSHFLKMLSYILENKKIGSCRTVEMFQDKLAASPALYELIKQATATDTETILFNVDIEGSSEKNSTAVMRVFAKMFYNHLGFFGENLKVARFEFFLYQDGKTEEFRRVFKEKSGKDWLMARKAFRLQARFVIPTLMEVFGLVQEDANKWFRDDEKYDFSIAALVEDIKYYLDQKPENFRLLFMIDEMGQYVGSDREHLLNLQSVVEKIGSTCGNRVWVVCTGQQALDKVIKLRNDEFSRIIARFTTILTLTSASAETVIQKRILEKKPEAETVLTEEYVQKDAVLRNLFTFTSETVGSMCGYENKDEFVKYYPFVPYQFFLLQKVFTELKEHGVIGPHQSGAERSMLSGFKEAAQKIQQEEHTKLAPFYLFYDTIKDAIDTPTREVINNCQKAAESGHGVQLQDTHVLKTLYLLRYVNKSVAANIDNLVVLMADQIDADKQRLREELHQALDRLYKQNFIDINGDVYCFLSNEEKDIKIEIENKTQVEASKVLSAIGKIASELYKANKIRFGKKDFDFDVKVDDVAVGRSGSNMVLQYITNIYGINPNEMLNCDNKVVVNLGQTNYYDLLEKVLKIRTFKNKNNINDMTETMRGIVSNYILRADKYEKEAADALQKAIETADFYVSGEPKKLSGDMKAKLDEVLQMLVGFVYNKYGMLDYQPDSDADVKAIALGKKGDSLGGGFEVNKDAADEMFSFLKMKFDMKQPLTVADVQKQFQEYPYGWREIDVAAVIAQLLYEQRVILKYSGAPITTEDSKLADMLRTKRYTGNVVITVKVSASDSMLRKVKTFLTSFFGRMDVPNDEDGLAVYIKEHFAELRTQYKDYEREYQSSIVYPGKAVVVDALRLVNEILAKASDNIAFFQAVLDQADALEDMKEDMEDVENFFSNQRTIFDEGVSLWKNLQSDATQYLYQDDEVKDAYNKIYLYTRIEGKAAFDYSRLAKIKGLVELVTTAHDEMLKQRKTELAQVLEECKALYKAEEDKHVAVCEQDAVVKSKVAQEVKRMQNYFAGQKSIVENATLLWTLDGRDDLLNKNTNTYIWQLRKAATPAPTPVGPQPKPEPKVRKTFSKLANMPSAVLKDRQDIDNYISDLRAKLLTLKNSCDEIEIR